MSIHEPGVVYLSEPHQWSEIVHHLENAGVMGLDTEFHGLDVRKESCVGKARVHVWSVAIRTMKLSPLGFHRARGWVLPAEALTHPPLRAVLEDPRIRKAVHNQPVDDHAINNHGVKLGGCINTLDMARWCWPELDSFGLKSLMEVKLHREPICDFRDVVTDTRLETVERLTRTRKKYCLTCAAYGCRSRAGHVKEERICGISRLVEKAVTFQHPLESIVPGHPRWELLVKYAAEDAVAALEILELLEDTGDPAPFPYTLDDRPRYNQRVSDAVVAMERRGFAVDTGYAGVMAERAEADEQRELAWLRRWYRANQEGELTDEGIDSIWSSNPKKVALFDALGFPRSPIWKRGRVKPGEVKMDGTAMEWIGKNHPPARQLLRRLLNLQRVRSGKKYLVKIRDCGGWVNPICGAAGDSDDRYGAVTGRLGVKGVLEAQQLPARDAVDLYQIRRAVIADPTRG